MLKWRETSLLVVVALVSALLAGAGSLAGSTLALLGVVGLLSCGGSACLNNYLDRDIDALALRTQKRPLPTGRIRPERVFRFGVLLVGSGVFLALKINLVVSFFVLLGSLFYVVVYTLLLKRRSVVNVEVGGVAGSCAVLAGWFSASPALTSTPILLALLLLLWTPSHFWSFALVHRESYRQAKIPMLPVLAGEKITALNILFYSLAVMSVSLLIYFVAPLQMIYLTGFMLLAGLFLVSNVRLCLRPEKGRAWTNYKLSGVYLLGLFFAMFVDIMVGYWATSS